MKKVNNGIILCNKPKEYTSRDVVNVVSKSLNTKKIGHTGTLDKNATGVLVLLIGKYTKLNQILVNDEKEYIATFKLGFQTDTLDIEGKVIKTSDKDFTEEKIINTINSFKGEYLQEVPMYSAVHVDGKRLYKYANENKKVMLPKRLVEIKKIDILSIEDDLIKCRFLVSKGTYIRSLVRDIGERLGTFATLIDLTRTKEGIFKLENTYTLDEIKNYSFKMLDLKSIFSEDAFIEIDDKKYKEITNGVKQKISSNKDYICFSYKGEIIALYKRDKEYYKMFIKLI